MKPIFDVAVIGSGIAGVSTAYQLSTRGAKILLLESARRGYGARYLPCLSITHNSGAAGCWINPFIYNRDAPVLNLAFTHSTQFYQQFPTSFEQTGSLLKREGTSSSKL